MTIAEKDVLRFLSKFERRSESECWGWMAGKSSKGYGRFKAGGITRYAHRVAYEIFVSDIPDGILVCHRCDVPSCVNPAHLFLGSHADNQHDKVSKARHTHGEGSPHAKLSESDVMEIYEFYERERSTLKVAAKFGITKNLAWRIVRGLQWKHLYAQRQLKSEQLRTF